VLRFSPFEAVANRVPPNAPEIKPPSIRRGKDHPGVKTAREEHRSGRKNLPPRKGFLSSVPGVRSSSAKCRQPGGAITQSIESVCLRTFASQTFEYCEPNADL